MGKRGKNASKKKGLNSSRNSSKTPFLPEKNLSRNKLPLQVKQEEIDAIQSRNISLRYAQMDKKGPFGFSTKKQQLLWTKLQPKMKHITSMTFDELMEGGDDHHSVSCSSLRKKAKKRLNKIGQHDLDELFSLRFGKLLRVYGIREHNILSILWLDPNHEVCHSNKKHT